MAVSKEPASFIDPAAQATRVIVVSGDGETPTPVAVPATSDVKHAAIAAGALGDNEIVAAVTGKQFAVVSYVLVADTAVAAKFASDATDLTGAMSLAANSVVTVTGSRAEPLFVTSVDEPLVLNLSAAEDVAGHLTYIEL